MVEPRHGRATSGVPGRGARAARAGRVPVWIPIGVLTVGAIWLGASLEHSVEAAGFASVDPRRARLDAPPGFRDPRWEDFLAIHLAGLDPIDARDPVAVGEVAREVARLPFVAEVGPAHVLWPDGIEVPLRLREPGACVLAGSGYLAVSTDGVVLPGHWPKPPLVGGRFLPVLGPNDGRFDDVRPGQRLAAPSDVDALAVALSMRASLGPEEFDLMGPPLVDAERARAAGVDEPGVRIHLEGRRTIHFGRAPGAGMPGELPTQHKWQHVRRALDLLRPENGARDWSILDARWDVADLAWRSPADVGETAARPKRAQDP